MLSTVSNKTMQNKNGYFTSITKISVKGLSNEKNAEILVKMNNFLHKSIFILKTEEFNKIMSDYNIIEEYNIKKIYPSKLDVEIIPTKLIAKISSNNHLIVGSNGKLIKTKVNDGSLPYIYGEFNSEKFLELKENIEFSKFKFKDFKTISFFSSSRWDILTTNDILIKLPERNLFKSLNLAHKILQNDEFKNSRIIDLRIKNQIIIQ